jgi:hypothetical protein
MSRYAVNTDVSSDKSRAEIERTLQRYGASGFMYGWQGAQAMIMFQMKGKTVKFLLPLPDKKDPKFWKTPGGRRQRDEAGAFQCWEQACRQKWRALALAVKAKLEAVDSEITVFEKEFLAHFVLPSGETLGDYVLPRMEKALAKGKMPLLIGPGDADTVEVEAT